MLCTPNAGWLASATLATQASPTSPLLALGEGAAEVLDKVVPSPFAVQQTPKVDIGDVLRKLAEISQLQAAKERELKEQHRRELQLALLPLFAPEASCLKRRASEAFETSSACSDETDSASTSEPDAKERRICSREGCDRRTKSRGLCSGCGGGRRCVEPGCERHATAAGLCRMHGGRRSCAFEGCSKPSKSGGLCSKHGGGPRCSFPECCKHVVSNGRCRAHGAAARSRKLCGAPGCTKAGKAGGFCCSHGGGRRCAAPMCTKHVVRAGFCVAHAKDLVSGEGQ